MSIALNHKFLALGLDRLRTHQWDHGHKSVSFIHFGMSVHAENVLPNLECVVGPKLFNKSFQFVFAMSQQQQQSETNVLAKIINNGSKTAQQR